MKRLALLALLGACSVEPTARPSLITAPVVIAVEVAPAEAPAGEDVTLTVTVATPDGPGDASAAAWALCTAPRPLTDNNAVAVACLEDEVAPVGEGATVTATLSIDACARFGPNAPPGGFRPRDPDPTGGYYQPVRVDVVDDAAFGMARLYCGLANAPLDATRRYAEEYTHNVAPVVDLVLAPATIGAGEETVLEVGWAAGTAETYLLYDPLEEALGDATENLTVSWFATGGELELDRTVGLERGSTNGWIAPAEPGVVHVWAVVRDDRGGAAVEHVEIVVE